MSSPPRGVHPSSERRALSMQSHAALAALGRSVPWRVASAAVLLEVCSLPASHCTDRGTAPAPATLPALLHRPSLLLGLASGRRVRSEPKQSSSASRADHRSASTEPDETRGYRRGADTAVQADTVLRHPSRSAHSSARSAPLPPSPPLDCYFAFGPCASAALCASHPSSPSLLMLASSAEALAGLSSEAKQLLAQSAQAEEMASEILWRKKMVRQRWQHWSKHSEMGNGEAARRLAQAVRQGCVVGCAVRSPTLDAAGCDGQLPASLIHWRAWPTCCYPLCLLIAICASPMPPRSRFVSAGGSGSSASGVHTSTRNIAREEEACSIWSCFGWC